MECRYGREEVLNKERSNLREAFLSTCSISLVLLLGLQGVVRNFMPAIYTIFVLDNQTRTHLFEKFHIEPVTYRH